MSVDYKILLGCSTSHLFSDVMHVLHLSLRLVAMEFGGFSEPLVRFTSYVTAPGSFF